MANVERARNLWPLEYSRLDYKVICDCEQCLFPIRPCGARRAGRPILCRDPYGRAIPLACTLYSNDSRLERPGEEPSFVDLSRRGGHGARTCVLDSYRQERRVDLDTAGSDAHSL